MERNRWKSRKKRRITENSVALRREHEPQIQGSTNLCGRLVLSGAPLCSASAGISAGPIRAIPARRAAGKPKKAAGKPKNRRLPEPCDAKSRQRGAHDATR